MPATLINDQKALVLFSGGQDSGTAWPGRWTGSPMLRPSASITASATWSS